MQALDAKLDAVLRQVEARGGRDPGDAVPPGVAVQSPAPLSTEDQAVLEKLETRRAGNGRHGTAHVRLTAASRSPRDWRDPALLAPAPRLQHKFQPNLVLALAAYRDAKVEVDERGVTLHPARGDRLVDPAGIARSAPHLTLRGIGTELVRLSEYRGPTPALMWRARPTASSAPRAPGRLTTRDRDGR